MGLFKKKAHILVVDDDPASLKTLSEILDNAGYDLSFAKTGMAALELSATQPDLVLLDYHLPDIDGLEVCSILKSTPGTAHTPVIIVTASSDPALEARGLEVGAADFLTKPYSATVLRARVRTHVLFRQQQLQLARSERQARAFLNTATDAVVVIDADSKVVEFNAAGSTMFGYKRDEVVGQSVGLLMPQSVAALHHHKVQSLTELNTARRMQIAREVLARHKSGREFPIEVTIGRAGTDSDLMYVGIVRDITDRRKLEMDMARARQRELDISAMIQKELLFGAPPSELTGFDIALFNRPSQGVDGDFHTFTRLGPKSFEILTGDVMGKGVSAALLGAGITNSYRRAVAELMVAQPNGGPPALDVIVNEMHRLVGSRLLEFNAFATMTLLRVDAEQMRVTWVNAGHTPTLLASKASTTVAHLSGDNLPLGVMENEVYIAHDRDLQKGDLLVFYSDGVSEAADAQRQLFGDEAIEQIVGQGHAAHLAPADIVHKLQQALTRHMGDLPPSDDMTAILVELQN